MLADRQANISYVDIIPHLDRDAEIYLEFAVDGAIEPIVEGLRSVPGVSAAEATPSFSKIYGKRIVIMGGGAQVGQVALGAITEADRHNIRGERISVDTIPLVGEEALAGAVRSVVRLPASACSCSPDRSWAATSPGPSKKCAARASSSSR